jgi:hypothetical protein
VSLQHAQKNKRYYVEDEYHDPQKEINDENSVLNATTRNSNCENDYA